MPRPGMAQTALAPMPARSAPARKLRSRSGSAASWSAVSWMWAIACSAATCLPNSTPADLHLQVEVLQAQRTAAEAQLARARADHARTASLSRDQLVSRSALDHSL